MSRMSNYFSADEAWLYFWETTDNPHDLFREYYGKSPAEYSEIGIAYDRDPEFQKVVDTAFDDWMDEPEPDWEERYYDSTYIPRG